MESDSVLAGFESGLLWARDEPARAPECSPWPGGVHPAVVATAESFGVARPWRHQATAMETLLRGDHVVLASGTATGKSLAYLAPALTALLVDPAARVLYLAPTKALARDQLAVLQRWDAGLKGPPVQPAALDGDTPRSDRAALRSHTRWLHTNPEMLHQSVLPNHTGWAAFFAGLRLLVLDELHVYRGVFGAHVANLLARLVRLVRFHGGGPLQVAACSATIANPEDLVRRLVVGPEAPVAVVRGDDAPRRARRVVCLEPQRVDSARAVRRRLTDEVLNITQRLAELGRCTAVFVRTRRAAEQLVRALRRRLGDGLEVPAREAVRSYRAGLRPAERRDVEQGLRAGRVRVVVATSALELGVDIGGLEAAVLAGYPGDLASLRQQAGRVGRHVDGGLVVILAGGGGLERYVLRRPDLVLRGRPERAHLDPHNPRIRIEHLRCAAFELPFEDDETLGPDGEDGRDAPLLESLVQTGELRQAAGRRFWTGGDPPAPGVGLRSLEARPLRLELDPGRGGKTRATVVGSLERSVALTLAHPGALYVHDGDAYRVTALHWDEGRVWLRPSDSSHVTLARTEHELALVDVDGERAVPCAVLRHGPTELTLRTTGYREVEPRTGRVEDEAELDLPEHTREAAALWLTLDPDTVQRLRDQGFARPDPVGYRGPDWQAQRRRARERDGYCCVSCGVEETERQHDIHHLQPFREFGYVRGVNEAFREANRLENLVTLCRACHARAEERERFQGALQRLAQLMGNLAPLLLMCDPRDLELRVWRGPAEDSDDGQPSLVLLEHAPAGVGYAAALFDLYEELLDHADELLHGCGCEAGCPACVGPPGGGETDGRAAARAVLALLRQGRAV